MANADMCQETEQLDYLNGDYEVAMWREGDSGMLPLGVGDDRFSRSKSCSSQ